MHSNFEMDNLQLKSTLSELQLYSEVFDVKQNLDDLRILFNKNISYPGVIITEKGKFIGIFPRKIFFENLSKPFHHELFYKKPISYYYEQINSAKPLSLSASTLITDAVKIALERPKDSFDIPILVEFESGKILLLDTYQLMQAGSHINGLALKLLGEANELKSDMLSIAAHDLKNPLNIIIGYTKLLISLNNNLDEDNLEMLGHIKDSAEQMLNLILELLNSTVIESGKVQLKMQYFDLLELITAIIYQSNNLISNKCQIVDFICDREKEYLLTGDTMKIRESIENLVSNAIKYSPTNSKIIIKLEKENNKLVFSVKDQGPGLTDDDKKKLFGKFQRLSATPTAGESSTGLGLYIAKQIIELHNGKIYVDSKYGKGCTFYIELPADEIY